MAREALAAAAIVLALFTTAAPSFAASETVVTVSNFAFTPSSVTLDQGDSIRWTWQSGTHSVRAGTPSSPGDLWCSTRSGGDCTRTFSTAGTFAYYCTVHPSSMQAQVTVASTAVPPTIDITSPADGTTVTGSFTVSGTASDDVGLDRVEVRVGTKAWVTATGTTSWSATLNTAGLHDGTFVVTARAYDVEGASADDTINIVADVADYHDLRLAHVFVTDGSLASGGTITLTARTLNHGTLAATSQILFEYQYKGDWYPIDTKSVYVTPGDAAFTTTSWSDSTKVGAFSIRATVDPQNTLAEADENNNDHSTTAGFWTRTVQGTDVTDP